MILALVRAAWGGCAVDPRAEEVWEAAPLVASGEVSTLEFVGDGVVEAIVQLDRPRVGTVDSGFLALRTQLTGAGCPGDEVWPPGARVWVVATPDADGVVWPSPCARDVVSGDADVSGAGRVAAAGRWAGAPPARRPPGPRAPLPTPDGRWARMLVPDELDSPVVSADPASVTVLAPYEAFDVLGAVPVGDLARVPVRPVALQPGVRVAPGAPLDPASGYHRAGVRVMGQVPADAWGVVWTPEAPRELETRAWVRHDTVLFEAPGGRVVAALALDGEYALRPTGGARDGFVEVEVQAPWLRATGWLVAGDVDPGAMGSLRGYGRGSGRQGTWLLLPEGALVATSDGAATFARARHETLVRWIAALGHEAWVLVPTPWGDRVGRVTCAAEPAADALCSPP